MDSKRTTYPAFVGKSTFKAYPQDGPRKWLQQTAQQMSAIVATYSPPEQWRAFVKVTTASSEDGLDFQLSVSQERAEDDLDRRDEVVARFRIKEIWGNAGPPPASLAGLRSDFSAIRQDVCGLYDEAWAIVESCPDSISSRGHPPGRDSLDALGCIFADAIRGEFRCPNCGRQALASDETTGYYGWVQCVNPECRTFFVEDHLNDSHLPDGVQRVLPATFPQDGVLELLKMGRMDEGSFHESSPCDEWKAGRMRIYVCVVGKRIVGYAAWNAGPDDERSPTLRQLWVHPEFRRKGHGRALLDIEAKAATAFGVESPNPDGRRLIESAGYGVLDGNGKAFGVHGM